MALRIAGVGRVIVSDLSSTGLMGFSSNLIGDDERVQLYRTSEATSQAKGSASLTGSAI
jgi:hypothetical protein